MDGQIGIAMQIVQMIVYANETSSETELVVEPWGEIYLIAPGDRVQIVGTGGEPGSAFELHQTAMGVTIFGWVGSIVSVLRDGSVVQPSPER
jgi:hypothetical protein